MGKNDFDIDFDFDEEYNFDPKAFLGTEEYDENMLLLNEHNVELKCVIDDDTPSATTISSTGFGFWDWLGI